MANLRDILLILLPDGQDKMNKVALATRGAKIDTDCIFLMGALRYNVFLRNKFRFSVVIT